MPIVISEPAAAGHPPLPELFLDTRGRAVPKNQSSSFVPGLLSSLSAG